MDFIKMIVAILKKNLCYLIRPLDGGSSCTSAAGAAVDDDATTIFT